MMICINPMVEIVDPLIEVGLRTMHWHDSLKNSLLVLLPSGAVLNNIPHNRGRHSNNFVGRTKR